MYKQTITIPRITQDQLIALEDTVPFITNVAKIPLISSEEQAISFATNFINSQLSTAEVVTGVESIVTDNDSWTITLNILD